MFPHEKTYTENPFATKAATNDQQRKRMKLIVRAIVETQLTERQKQIMLMRYAEEKSIKQIAEILGINPSNVCRRIQAAKKRISKIKKIFKYIAY